MTTQECTSCSRFQEIDQFGRFKMCATCRAGNTLERKNQRAKNLKLATYRCECCDFNVMDGVSLKRHLCTELHQYKVFSAECERMGMAAAPMEPARYTNPIPVESRFNIKDRPIPKHYDIQWQECGERVHERFSYRLRPKEEAMTEALARQAELRAC